MRITEADWKKYREKQDSLTTEASDKMLKWLESHGGYENIKEDAIIEYAHALATKYGEGSASLAAQMYDASARVSKVNVPSAEVAETAHYNEIERAVFAVTNNQTTDAHVASIVGRAVKQAGADTTLKNAIRDGAEFAWIPSGDGCAYCMAIAAEGWHKATKNTLEGNHAEHIHPNCMCEFAIRFDSKSGVKGYDPDYYKNIYDNAEGRTAKDKINSIRRIQYQENKDVINAQKRANYNEKQIHAMKRNDETSWSGEAKKITEEELNSLQEAASLNGFVLDQTFKSFDGDVSLVKDFINGMNENLGNKSFMRHRNIKLSVSYTMNDADYAQTEGSNIIINGFAYRDRKLLEADYKKRVEEKWFTQGSTYLDIATHESGHVIVYMDQLKYAKTTSDVFGKDLIAREAEIVKHISIYALKNDEELISEAYVLYKNGSKDPYVLKVLRRCGIVD